MPNFLAVAGPGSKYSVAGAPPADFWAGLWHGLIVPITFLISLVTTEVRIYEMHNNGRWYDFGFLFGVSLIWGGSGYGARA
jgi:hypothetical protein